MPWKRLPVLTLRAFALAYVAAVVFMSLAQTRLVFPGAYIEAEGRALLPSPDRISWDTTSVETDDGGRVVLLTAPHPAAAEAAPWALFFHGNAGLLGLSGSVRRYELLHDAGFNVAAVEFRGYGVAEALGSPSEAALYSDARAAFNHLSTSQNVDAGQVVFYGWSLGSGPATYLAAELDVAGLVTEGAFTSVPDVGAAMYPWLPVRWLARHRFPNLERAPDLTMPWLVFHARADAEIEYVHAENLANASENARLLPLRGGHDNAAVFDRSVTLPALREMAAAIRGGRP